ncbi:MAG: DUF2147 domain-containing protein [Candidatus Sericytochromatia bacterium]
MSQLGQRFLWSLFLLVCFLPGSASLAASATDIVGVWITPEGKSHVQISQQSGKFTGKLIHLKEPLRNGKPKLDAQNSNASLRSRPLMGLSLLSGFVFKGDHWEGKIYNPEDGKEYSCQLRLKNAKVLEVRGYVLNPALGKTQIWNRKP